MDIKDRVNRLRQLRDEAGKFTKAQAYYAEDAAIQKGLRCGNCFYYQGNGKCALVSEKGEPGKGVISRQGTCSLWNAAPARITAIQWLWGRDELEGVPPETVRATTYMFTYAGLNETPPAELREKSVFNFEDIDELVPGKIAEFMDI